MNTTIPDHVCEANCKNKKNTNFTNITQFLNFILEDVLLSPGNWILFLNDLISKGRIFFGHTLFEHLCGYNFIWQLV